MEMRVPDGGCFCLFAFPIGRFDLCVSVLEGHSRRGAPLPFVLFSSTSKVPVRNMQV